MDPPYNLSLTVKIPTLRTTLCLCDSHFSLNITKIHDFITKHKNKYCRWILEVQSMHWFLFKVKNNDIKWNIIVVIVVVVNIIINNTTDQERDCKTKAKEKVNPKWKSLISVKPVFSPSFFSCYWYWTFSYYEFVQVLTTIGLPVVSIGSNNVQTVHNKDIKP